MHAPAEVDAALPRLDEDGLLWVGPRWVAIPDAQLPVARLLLEHPNRVVSTPRVADVYASGGSSRHQASVRTMIHRVIGRFARVGLRVHVIRGKGLLLEVDALL